MNIPTVFCPWSTNHASISANSARICRPCSAKRLATARFSLVYLPWVVRAAVSRARPSSVFGLVDFPPCREQRPLRLYAGLWQGVPLRVLAPHRWPGQSGPKCHGILFSRLLFVMLKSPPRMGFYYTPYLQVVRGLGGLVHGTCSKQNHPL
jgi:hypothetical protein